MKFPLSTKSFVVHDTKVNSNVNLNISFITFFCVEIVKSTFTLIEFVLYPCVFIMR